MRTTSALTVYSEVVGPTATVCVRGSLDVATAGDVRRCLRRLVGDGTVHIRLDLSSIDFIDSTGIGAIVGAHQVARRAGGDLILRSPTRQVMRALELTSLVDVLEVEDVFEGVDDGRCQTAPPPLP